ncbi:MAG: hypothetical protein QOD99_821 [Chthoniobacter sp.]|jgi:hypothetical protein|nr:hypothetical protein [Chthoniobacter sp.]
MRPFFPALLLILFSIRAGAAPQFDPGSETFAFSNDTVFSYGVDEAGQLTMRRKEKEPPFAHRCFVLCRAVLQFHKFAVFAPDRPRMSDVEYRRLVRRVSRIPVWFPEARRGVVIPGYTSLHQFSRGHERMLKEELGNWFPTYLRFGNWRMVGPFPRWGQSLASRRLIAHLDEGALQAVYITRFPKMNHCLIVFDYQREKNGDVRFVVYDPNYPNEIGTLRYSASEKSFDFPKRWFWTGGRVNLMRVYLSPLH